jgi:aspartate aminotransferase
VVSDEIYEYINFDGQHESIAQFPGMAERTIVINGMSKGFAMTGWRLGFIGAPLWMAKACTKYQGQFTSGACSIAQRAALAALQGPLDAPNEMRAAYARRKELVMELIKDLKGFRSNNPQGAFYVFPDVSELLGKSDGTTTIHTSYDLAMYLLDKAHVSLVSGEGFGAPECIRISFAASDDDLREAFARMKKAIDELR